jgi:hypothetical protein
MSAIGDNMNLSNISDHLSRTVKLAMDSGEAATAEEAQRIFEGYRLRIAVGSDISQSPTRQAALLTAVNVARRCFLGGVEVVGCPNAELLILWRDCRTVADAVRDLKGELVEASETANDLPLIFIGDGGTSLPASEFAVRATFDGWRGGVIPVDDREKLPERREFTPTGVLAGALAVSEAFQYVRGRNRMAGRRRVGLSLWRPEASWLDDGGREPDLEWLPAKLWLIGLGHLGQSYLWTLGFLPYDAPKEVSLVLQDYDTLAHSNDSTSPLTNEGLVGRKKARAMAEWCEGRGFHARVYERRFASDLKLSDEEPRVALCGVDNEAARACLEDVGFAQIIEAGLGLGTEEYLAFQMHCFPSSRAARARWGGSSIGKPDGAVIELPAYRNLAVDGLDECGLTQLAGRSVGACFVGTVVSTLVIAEVLRMCMGERRYEVIDGSLRAVEHRTVVASSMSTSPFNPGRTRATNFSRIRSAA